MSSGNFVIDHNLQTDELFRYLGGLYDLPVPPERIVKDVVVAMNEFDKFYNIGNLVEETVSRAANVASTERRRAKIQERRVRKINEELKKQLSIFQRDGGSIATQASSKPPRMNTGRQATLAEVDEVQPFSRSAKSSHQKVLEWQEKNKGNSSDRNLTYSISQSIMNQTSMDVSDGFADVDAEQDPDAEIHDAFPSYDEELTDIDDSGLVPAEFFKPAQAVAGESGYLTGNDSAQALSDHHYSAKKPDRSIKLSDALPTTPSKKSSSRSKPGSQHFQTTTDTTTAHSPPAKPVTSKNYNWGQYIPPDIYSSKAPPPSSSSSTSHRSSSIADKPMDDNKRKRPLKAASNEKDLTSRPVKRQSPNQKERTSTSSQPFGQAYTGRPAPFKVPELPSSTMKENNIPLRTSASLSMKKSGTQTTSMSQGINHFSFETASTSQKTSFAFDEGPTPPTAQTSFNSTMEVTKDVRSKHTQIVEVDDAEDENRFEDISESMIPSIDDVVEGSPAVPNLQRPSSASTNVSRSSRSVFQSKRLHANNQRPASPSTQLRRESSDLVPDHLSQGTYSIGASTEQGMLALEGAYITNPPPLEQSAPQMAPTGQQLTKQHSDENIKNIYHLSVSEEIPFWLSHELHRYYYGTSAKNDPNALNKCQQLLDMLLVTKDLSSVILNQSFREIFEEYVEKNSAMQPFPRDVFQVIGSSSDQWGNEIGLSADVTFSKTGKSKNALVVPNVALRAPRLNGYSHRYGRKFGSHRFMVFRISGLRKGFDMINEEHWDSFQKHFIENSYRMAGRNWRAIYFQDPDDNEKKGEKRRKKEKKEITKIIMFAESGHDLEAIDRLEAINWLIPIDKNLHQTECKFFSRIKLGFSRTMPSVVFDKEDISFIEDMEVGKELLTDGCGLVSPAVMRAIKRIQNLDHLPGAVQARIGPAKGLWIVDPDFNPESDKLWIQIRDSQKKFEGINLDEISHRTLDVVRVSSRLSSSNLNLQFLPILLHNGVPFEVFADLLREDIGRELGEVFDKLSDSVYLKGFLERYKLNSSRKGTGTLATDGTLPKSLSERVVLLLEAGFTLESCEILRNWFKTILRDSSDQIQDRMHITVLKSRTPFCVADPTGKLKKGEVYLRLSEPFLHDKTELPIDLILGDVLVGRNPAHVASDIQKVKAVDIYELRHLRDVIVFPAPKDGSCDRSLASYLSGGDYDGDTAWVCWDSRIVESFQNANIEPTNVDCRFKKDRTKMEANFGQIVRKRNGSSRNIQLESHALTMLIAKHLKRAAEPNILGTCTNYWEQAVYHLPYGIAGETSKLLAALCSKLVDAPKQGDEIRKKWWGRVPGMIKAPKSGKKDLTPLYKQKDFKYYRLEGSKSENEIDQLRFVVAYDETTRLMDSFDEKFPLASSVDSDIIDVFNAFRDPYDERKRRLEKKEKKREPLTSSEVKELAKSREIIEAIDTLNRTLQALVCDKWRDWNTGRDADQESETEKEEFDLRIQRLVRTYRNIKPCSEHAKLLFSHDTGFRRPGPEIYSEWSLLRAAALFIKVNGGILAWKMAAEELAYLKVTKVSEITGRPVRLQTENMYLTTKVRSSAMRKEEEHPWIFGEPDDLEFKDDALED